MTNLTMILPSYLKSLMQEVIAAGYECYLVGGAVRDYIINVENKDYDLTTNMPLSKLKEMLPALTIMKENSHRNTGVIRTNNYDIEFSSFRGTTLKEDLENRDFKMNALAATISGNIIDYVGGVEDIKNKKVSLVKESGEGLEQDPLRILRALRQADKYNFKIDSNLKDQLLLKAHLLKNVSKERIYEELKKILLSDNIEYYLLEYKEIFFELIPALRTCDGFDQHNKYHIYDVYTHIVKTVSKTDKNLYLRLAALFHDSGKPIKFTLDETNTGHFLHHSKASLDIFKKFAKEYKLDNKTKKIVANLISYHEDTLSPRPAKIYDFYQKYDMDYIELLFALKEADIKSQNEEYLSRLKDLELLKEKYLEVKTKYQKITYNGSALIELGYTGKEIGTILKDLKREIIINKLENDPTKINDYVLKKYS